MSYYRFTALSLLAAAFIIFSFSPAQGEDNTVMTVDGVSSNLGGANVTIGNTGTNNVLIVTNGGVLVNAGGTIGSAAGALNNSATVIGSGSLWNNSGALTIGSSGSSNTLTIGNGGTVYNAGGTIGNAAGAVTNAVNVTGTGSVWNIGAGTMTIGNNVGATGNMLNVSSGGMLTNGALVFGGRQGALNITNGGKVYSTADIIGNVAGANSNVATVSGDGSMWTNATLAIGNNAATTGSILNVINGGVLSNSTITMSGNSGQFNITNSGKVYNNGAPTVFSATALSNTVTITDPGSLWYMGANDLTLGGSLNVAIITNGATVRDNNFLVTGYTNTVVITGPGTVLTNSRAFQVGNAGFGNLGIISNGAKVYFNGNNSDPRTGVGGGGTGGNKLIITGSGSLLRTTVNDENLFMIRGSDNNCIIVDNGGMFDHAGSMYNVDKTNNGIIVTGPGSVWNCNINRLVGHYDYFVVTNGGNMNASIGGNSWTGTKSLLCVSDPGSVWNFRASNLFPGTTYTNTLLVLNGGVASNIATLNLGNGAGAYNNNSVLLTNAGLLELNTGLSVGNAASSGNVLTNWGGILQFISAAPAISIAGAGNSILMTNATLSYRNVANVDLTNNWGVTGVGSFTWRGSNNTLRLDNSTATNSMTGPYTFSTALGSTNYARLELINGATAFRGQGLTLADIGSMLVSNTTVTLGSIFVSNSANVVFNNSFAGFSGMFSNSSPNVWFTNSVLELNALASGAGGSFTNFGSGRISAGYQFTNVSPLVTAGAVIALQNGALSYRNVTNADVKANWLGWAGANDTTNITLLGSNGFELNWATNTADASRDQSYTFSASLGATNFAGLAMVNGTTRYRNGAVTIAADGWLLISNTIAIFDGAVTNLGNSQTINSTVTYSNRYAIAAGATNTVLNSTVNYLGGYFILGSGFSNWYINSTLSGTGYTVRANDMLGFAATNVWGADTNSNVGFKIDLGGWMWVSNNTYAIFTVPLTNAGSVLISSNAILRIQKIDNTGTITNDGGMFEFTNVVPVIATTPGSIVMTNGAIGYLGVTNADIRANVPGYTGANASSNITYQGNNLFRLNTATNTLASSQSYTFSQGLGGTNFAGLVLVSNGVYRTLSADTVTFTNNASLLVTNCGSLTYYIGDALTNVTYNFFGTNGGGTVWDNGTRPLTVGNGAAISNVLNVAGGLVTNLGAVIIGNSAASSNNAIVITGSGAVYSASTVTIGNAAGSAGNSLTVSNGTFYNKGLVLIGNVAGANSNQVNVMADGVWDFGNGNIGTENLKIGVAGSAGNVFSINGGIVTNVSQRELMAGSGNSVIITNGGQFYFGNNGGYGDLQVTGNNNIFYVGGTNSRGRKSWVGSLGRYYTTGGTSNSWIVGSGGVMTNFNSTAGAFSGSYNSLQVIDGGQFWSGGANAIGANTSIGDYYLATGTNSILSLGSLYVGYDNNAASWSSNNFMIVSNGAKMIGSGALIVGYAQNASGAANCNYLNIYAGSILTNSGLVTIGSGANSISNSVFVSNAGYIGSIGLAIGASGAKSNSVNLVNSRWNLLNGTLTWGSVGSASNSITLDSTSAITNIYNMTLNEAGLVATLNNNILNGGGSMWFSGGALNLGTVAITNPISLVITNSTINPAGGSGGASVIGGSSFSNTLSVFSGSLWNLGGQALTIGAANMTGNVMTVNAGIVTNGGAFNITGVSNTLMVTGGGQVYVNGYADPSFSGYGNQIIIDGGRFVNAGNWLPGGSTGTNTIIVKNGGYFQQTSGPWVGRSGGAVGNYYNIIITDPGSQWVGGGMQLGGDNANTHDHSIIVSNGAMWTDTSIYIGGNNRASYRNQVTVTGTGSVLTNSGSVLISNGANASNNTLTVAAGGTVYGNLSMASANAANSNIVTVTGSGSIWNMKAGTATIGSAANTGNVMNVVNGAVVTNVTSMTLGGGAGSFNNSLVITNGGKVFSTSGAVGSAAAKSNSVIVTDSGSIWDLSAGALTIGNNATTTGNVLNVLSGGSVTNVGILTLGAAGAGCSNNQVSVNGGILSAASLVSIVSNNTVSFPAGLMNLAAATVSNGVQFVVGDGVNIARLNAASGTLGFSNGLFIASNSVLSGAGTVIVPAASVGGVIVTNGGSFYGGQNAGSPGALTLNTIDWQGGASLVVPIVSVAGTPGSSWGLVNVTGVLTNTVPGISNIISLVGAPPNMNTNATVSMKILTYGAGTVISTNNISINTNNFTGGGNWTLLAVSNALYLQNIPASNLPTADLVWTNLAGGLWNVAGNWEPNTAPFAGGTNSYVLTFTNSGTASYTATNNSGTPAFTNNALVFVSTSTGTGRLFSAGTTSLVFTANGATNPAIYQNGSGAFILSNNMTLAADLTFGGSGYGMITLASNIFGTGSVTFAGINETVLSKVNSFTGLVTVNTLGGQVTLVNTGAFNTINNVTLNSGIVTNGGGATYTVGNGVSNVSYQVNGAGSVWNNGSQALIVGFGAATGNWLVVNGGLFTNTAAVTIGGSGTSFGNSISITSSGKFYSANFIVGNGTHSNNLNVSAGGLCNMGSIGLALGTGGGIGNVVTINAGSITNAGTLTVGAGAASMCNSVTITNGGSLFSGAGLIGNAAGANSNTVIVTDAGSLWKNSGVLNVGSSGSSNSMIITNGGKVFSTGTATIGNAAGASSNLVVVSGVNSVWDLGAAALTIGNNVNTGNVLNVLNGGVVTNAGSTFYIGANTAGACFNTLNLNNGGRVFSGVDITLGRVNGANSNNISVLTNSVLDMAGNRAIYIGDPINAIGNVLNVDNGMVTNCGAIRVGVSGMGNTMTVTNGGKVFTTVSSGIGWSAGSRSNTVTITGSGSMWNLNAQTFAIANAASTGNVMRVLSGGVLTNAAMFTVGNSAGAVSNSVYASGGFLSSAGLIIGGQSNSVTLADSSTWNLGGNVLVWGIGLGASSNNLAADATSIITNFNSLVLGDNNRTYNMTNSAGGYFLEGIATAAFRPMPTWSLAVGPTGSVGTVLIISNYTLSTISSNDIGRGNAANYNGVNVTGSGAAWSFGGANLTVGGNGTATGNWLRVENGGLVTNLATLSVGSLSRADYNSVLLTNVGLMEVTSGITVGNNTSYGNSITNRGGILQFTAAAPTITINLFGGENKIVMDSGTLSYRNSTGVDISANATGSGVGLFNWNGLNVFRLNGSTETGVGFYTFANNLGAKNYTALELFNTCSMNRAITIDGANGGSILFSDAAVTLGGGVTLSGTARLTEQATASSLAGAIGGYGSLVKAGAGTLTLANANTYSGRTIVSNGVLRLSAANALAGSRSITVAGGATLCLSANDCLSTNSILSLDGSYGKMILSNTVVQSVYALKTNGVAQSQGTWGASGSGSQHTNDNCFTGSGLLNVLSAVVDPRYLYNWSLDQTNVVLQVAGGETGITYNVYGINNNLTNAATLLYQASNTTAFTYIDTNALGSVERKFYRVTEIILGVESTNTVIYTAFRKQLDPGGWYKYALGIDYGSFNRLDSALGVQLAQGLTGNNTKNSADLFYMLDALGDWAMCYLNGSGAWCDYSSDTSTNTQVLPWESFWIKRRSSGSTANPIYAGYCFTNALPMTFRSNDWHMITWSLPMDRKESDGAQQGWGFAAAGGQKGGSWLNSDVLTVGDGAALRFYYLHTSGRWCAVGSTTPASNVNFHVGEAYYYMHRGTGMTWTATEP